jgi:hypothetical protein
LVAAAKGGMKNKTSFESGAASSREKSDTQFRTSLNSGCCKGLRAHERTEKRVKEQKGTLIVPALFPDSSVGIPKPMSGRFGTDVQELSRGRSVVRPDHSNQSLTFYLVTRDQSRTSRTRFASCKTDLHEIAAVSLNRCPRFHSSLTIPI